MYCVGGRFVQYNPTSLERNYKHDLLTEVDLGVPIDIILPEAYSVDPSSELFVVCILSVCVCVVCVCVCVCSVCVVCVCSVCVCVC